MYGPNAYTVVNESFLFFVLIRPTSLVIKKHFICIFVVQMTIVGLLAQGQNNNFLATIYAFSPFHYRR